MRFHSGLIVVVYVLFQKGYPNVKELSLHLSCQNGG